MLMSAQGIVGASIECKLVGKVRLFQVMFPFWRLPSDGFG